MSIILLQSFLRQWVVMCGPRLESSTRRLLTPHPFRQSHLNWCNTCANCVCPKQMRSFFFTVQVRPSTWQLAVLHVQGPLLMPEKDRYSWTGLTLYLIFAAGLNPFLLMLKSKLAFFLAQLQLLAYKTRNYANFKIIF